MKRSQRRLQLEIATEAIATEAATGFDSALSRLRQSNINEEEQQAALAASTSMLMQPPSGDYFATWTSKGFTSLEGTPTGDILKAQVRSPADIEPFLAQFRGQAGFPALKRIAVDMKRAKGLTRPILTEDIYQLKKGVRDYLADLF